MNHRPWHLMTIVMLALLGTCIAVSACKDSGRKAAIAPEKPPTKVEEQQQETPRQKPTPPPESVITYPRDKDRIMAKVNGRNITLSEIVKHIDTRHFKGFENLVSLPAGQFELRTPRLPDWTRQYADVVALRTEARKLGIKETLIAKESGAALTEAFAQFTEDYERQSNRAFPTQSTAVKALRDRFLKERGIGLEVEGLLNAMVPDDLDQIAADNHLKMHIEEVNGILMVAHIFVSNRDRKTGERFGPERMRGVREKVAEIKRRLDAGDLFEKVAAEMSEDKITAPKGGRLDNLLRFDSRMPASFCRAAWKLRNRTAGGPIETKYGLHFIRRIKWTIRRTVLRLMAANKDVRRLVRTHRQEDFLFKSRADNHVELLY